MASFQWYKNYPLNTWPKAWELIWLSNDEIINLRSSKCRFSKIKEEYWDTNTAQPLLSFSWHYCYVINFIFGSLYLRLPIVQLWFLWKYCFLLSLLSDVLSIGVGFNLDISLATASAVLFPIPLQWLGINWNVTCCFSDSTNRFFYILFWNNNNNNNNNNNIWVCSLVVFVGLKFVKMCTEVYV